FVWKQNYILVDEYFFFCCTWIVNSAFKNEQNDFYEYFFKTNTWHKYLQQNSNSGARYDRMNITNNDFMSMPLPMLIPKEQQAIADCLSSLDNLINEQNERIGRLKTHKKGLMQQLFPTIQ
ncbi:restriction endonuclease subunit S, partial [Glaesserella parasuis]|nr:restriction endonuclease subunit S [Glaesserella parasuis]